MLLLLPLSLLLCVHHLYNVRSATLVLVPKRYW
jgi:hypothetical protein